MTFNSSSDIVLSLIRSSFLGDQNKGKGMKKSYWLLSITIFKLILLSLSCEKNQQKDIITVVSREASSGTRTAFDQSVGLVNEGKTAEFSNTLFKESITSSASDSVVLSVANDPNAIGYTSLASVSEETKVISLNSIKPSLQTFSNKSYHLMRPFVFLMKTSKKKENRILQDFLNFVMSREGQKIVKDTRYIPVKKIIKLYTPFENLNGKIMITGSSSLEKVMSKLQESYAKIQKNISLEIQYIGSTAGIQNVLQEMADLGMSSRPLTNEEKKSLEFQIFAYDGIVLVVNRSNPIKDLSIENLHKIYSGQIRHWSKLSQNVSKD